MTLQAISLNSTLFGEAPVWERERADYWFLAAESLWPLQLLSFCMIFMCDPKRPNNIGPLQITSALLGATSGCLLGFRAGALPQSELNAQGGRTLIWHVMGTSLGVGWTLIICKNVCTTMKGKFSTDQVGNYVYVVRAKGSAINVTPPSVKESRKRARSRDSYILLFF